MIGSTREALEQIDDIEQRGEDLSEWEQQFIDSVSAQEKLTYGQRAIIARIHEQKVR